MHWTEIPKQSEQDFKRLACPAPDAQSESGGRNEKRTDGPGEESTKICRNEQPYREAAAGENCENDPGKPDGRELTGDWIRR